MLVNLAKGDSQNSLVEEHQNCSYDVKAISSKVPIDLIVYERLVDPLLLFTIRHILEMLKLFKGSIWKISQLLAKQESQELCRNKTLKANI